MGRTNPTFRNALRAVQGRWGDYRRALRHADQRHFDALFEHAEAHADAAGYLNHEEPLHPVLVSMLLEHQRLLVEHRAQVADLQERTARLEDRLERPEDRDQGQGQNRARSQAANPDPGRE